MSVIQLGPEHYRRLSRRKKIKLRFWEAMPFAIASTLATRKVAPVDPAKTDRQFNAFLMGVLWFFIHQ